MQVIFSSINTSTEYYCFLSPIKVMPFFGCRLAVTYWEIAVETVFATCCIARDLTFLGNKSPHSEGSVLDLIFRDVVH